MEPPPMKYARSGDASIAYQVLGDGPRDLVFVPGFVSHLEAAWEHRHYERFMSRLSSFARVIALDKRGCGMSDPLVGSETFEQRMDDVRAVMDAAGSEHAALFGISEGASMSLLFAATYPERVDAVIAYGAIAKGTAEDEFPWGIDSDTWDEAIAGLQEVWGEGVTLLTLAPDRYEDEAFRRWWGRFERLAGSPRIATTALSLDREVDVREALPLVQAPVLLLHRIDDVWPVEGARYIEERVPHAKLREFEGNSHWPWIDDPDNVLDEVEEFLTGARQVPEPDRVLATVLFTDIVASTERAAELGDRGWRELVERHDELIRRQLDRYSGREVKTMGDGFLATFDGPARAIQAARGAVARVRDLGIDIRAGLHTGECELMNGDVGGIAVNIGARVSSKAGPGEVLVSSTVKDLVVGSGLEFADRGAHELKGVPGEWRLYAVEGGG